MLYSLMTKAPAHAEIIEMISGTGRGELLWALTQFGDERVRTIGLKVFCCVFHNCL